MELAPQPWELFWQIDSVAVLNEIESFYYYHTDDKEDTFLFDRHANYYTGEFDDIAVRGAYIKHSGIFFYGFAFLWRKTGNPQYLEWMKKEAELFRRSRHPQTGLLPDAAFGGGWSSQTPMLVYYVLLAYQQDRAQNFLLEYAEDYLQNFLKAISDPESDHFFAAAYFETGTPATSANLDFWTRNSPGAYLGKTAVLLYRETQNPVYLEYAKKLARALESRTGEQ